MESFPHGAMIVISVLPLLGLGTLAVVLFALGANRERAILPGVVVVLLAASSWGAAMEFGPRLKSLLPADKPVVETPAPTNDIALNDVEVPEEPPVADEPDTTEETPLKKPKRVEEPHLVPLIEDPPPSVNDDRDDKPFKRREYRVNSRRDEIPRRPTPQPTPKPETRTPTRETTPPPAELQPVPRETPKPPTPRREVARNDNLTPPSSSSPSTGGSGTLVVKISGTVVENSMEKARSPHLMVIIDGEKMEIVGPTNVSENYVDNNPSKGLQGVLYTWSGVTLTFPNLEAGFHFIMVDTSLDDPGTHQREMLGSAKEANDYNGTVEITGGQTTTVEMGGKNFMSGKMKRIR